MLCFSTSLGDPISDAFLYFGRQKVLHMRPKGHQNGSQKWMWCKSAKHKSWLVYAVFRRGWPPSKHTYVGYLFAPYFWLFSQEGVKASPLQFLSICGLLLGCLWEPLWLQNIISFFEVGIYMICLRILDAAGYLSKVSVEMS